MKTVKKVQVLNAKHFISEILIDVVKVQRYVFKVRLILYIVFDFRISSLHGGLNVSRSKPTPVCSDASGSNC